MTISKPHILINNLDWVHFENMLLFMSEDEQVSSKLENIATQKG